MYVRDSYYLLVYRFKDTVLTLLNRNISTLSIQMLLQLRRYNKQLSMGYSNHDIRTFYLLGLFG
jgi:hypothetical protein